MNCSIRILYLFFVLLTASCSPKRSIIVNEKAELKSSLAEIVKYGNDKSKIARKLPNRIGNMELFNVVDYTKRIVIGPDLGYGIFYDLKNNRHGSGNIFLYKQNKRYVDDGISNDALTELNIERQSIEKTNTTNADYSTAKFGNLVFYKMKFVSAPDKQDKQYDSYLFITGHKGVYIKVLFYYSKGAEYGEEETSLFMNSLSRVLESGTV